MDELTIDQLKQLVAFYKQRSSDLELEVLKFQLKNVEAKGDVSEHL